MLANGTILSNAINVSRIFILNILLYLFCVKFHSDTYEINH
jgi:hypothetical protein